jgi:ATP-dependent DNA ligase
MEARLVDSLPEGEHWQYDPALLMAFDLLQDEKGHSLLKEPLAERRPRLETFARRYFKKSSLLHLSSATTDIAQDKTPFADWHRLLISNSSSISFNRCSADSRKRKPIQIQI